MIKLDKQGKLDVQNVLKLLRRAKYDGLLGIEALAMARAYAWLESLLVEDPPPTVIPHESPITEPEAKEVKVGKKKKDGQSS